METALLTNQGPRAHKARYAAHHLRDIPFEAVIGRDADRIVDNPLFHCLANFRLCKCQQRFKRKPVSSDQSILASSEEGRQQTPCKLLPGLDCPAEAGFQSLDIQPWQVVL